MKDLIFKKSFLMGTATASLQIEGGDRNNNWYEWCEKGHIKDGSHCITANDHWNRVDQDIQLMKDLNNDAYRFGLEWSRIEPSKGEFDPEAMAHYRLEIEKLIAAGIHPLVTLHHFSQPLWIEHKGGWTHPDVVDEFLSFTSYVLEHIGDLISDWVTINEPNVYLTMGYIEGEFPPGKKGDVKTYLKCAKSMIEAHIKSYQLIHRVRVEAGYMDTKVGVANHLRVFEPLRGTRLEKFSCKQYYRFFQDIFLDGMSRGKKLWPLMGHVNWSEGNYADFLGINYYSRDIIKSKLNPFDLFGERLVNEGSAVNDLGWEIYPEGLYLLMKQCYEKYKVPIYITENGTCDAEDSFRSKFIIDHLIQIKRAIADGIPVERYYHWTLMDNFEWAEGYSARFGLYHCDDQTQVRTLRKSGKLYGDICGNRV